MRNAENRILKVKSVHGKIVQIGFDVKTYQIVHS